MGTNNFFVDFIKNLQVNLSEEYIKSSTTAAIIVGIVAAALIIASAFLMNKNKGIGIAAGIFQIAGVFGVQKMAHIFARMDLYRYEYITGSSQAELDQKMNEFYSNYFNELLGDLIPYMLLSLLFMASWIMTLVFIVKCMNVKPKILPVFALVIQIFRYLFVSPFPVFKAISGPVTEAMQASTDKWNYIVVLLPLVLILVAAILTRVKMGKEEPEVIPVAAVEIDADAVEVAAGEAEAEAVETVETVEAEAVAEDAANTESTEA